MPVFQSVLSVSFTQSEMQSDGYFSARMTVFPTVIGLLVAQKVSLSVKTLDCQLLSLFFVNLSFLS